MSVNGNYKIDTHVPLPKMRGAGGKGNYKYPWNEMEVGQSFFVPDTTIGRFYSQTRAAAKRYSKKFIARSWVNDDGAEGVRIWRVE
jgi:hypothetical protein